MIDEKGEGAHSEVGPSAADRWINCPGSVKASRGMPDTANVFSDEGTVAHSLLEKCWDEDRSAYPFIGVKQMMPTGEVEVTAEMADAIDDFNERCSDMGGQNGIVLNESRVRYESLVPGGFGTLDRAILMEEIGIIMDFKYGKGILVEAEWNFQLMLYAYSVWLDYNWIFGFKKFVLFIGQPRLDNWDRWEISVEDLVKWAESTVRYAGQAALGNHALVFAGDHCQWCRIAVKCATRAKWWLNHVVGEFDNLDEGLAMVRSVGERFSELSGDQLAVAVLATKNIASWIKDIKAAAMRDLQQGKPVGDLKLVAGRNKRLWTLPPEKIEQELLEAGMELDDIWARKLITPPMVEKKMGKKADVMMYVDKLAGRPTIASGGDKRQALSIDALKEFEDLGADATEDDDE